MAVTDFSPNIHSKLDPQFADEVANALRRIRKALKDIEDGGVASTYAPATAKYLLQVAHADLASAQAMGALATGITRNTTTTGVQSSSELSGDVTTSGSNATTLATVNANVGTFGSATAVAQVTANAKGLITAAANVTVTPAVGSITGLGTGVATWLATPSSANLASAVTDETGTGALVFANSPVFTTPNIGSATGSISGNAATVTTNANLTGPVTSAGNATTITPAAVTLAMMANLAQDQFVGRVTASTGVPETATITAAARTVLDDASVSAMVDTLGGASATGTGGLVRATSPTIVTPTIAAAGWTNANHTHAGATTGGTLANAVGLPLATGVTGILPVANGGTGAASETAYAVLCGGTTSTNPLQSVASVGSAGQVLMSNGAGALPTFQGSRRWTLQWDAPAVDMTDTAFAVHSIVTTTLRPCIAFDQTTDESIVLSGVVPSEFVDSTKLRVRLIYCASTTTAADDVRFDVVTEFRTPGAGEAMNADNYDATPDSVTGTFSTTAYAAMEATVTLTPATTPAAGDAFRIKVTRDANHATDDSLAQDCLVVGFELYEVI